MKRRLYVVIFAVAVQCHAQVSDFDHINFHKADSIALACKNEGLVNMPQLVSKLTSHLSTDVERFRAIYRWVCGNIANDYSQYSLNMRKRERFRNDTVKLQDWNEKFRNLSFQRLLEKQRTICTGYAYLVSELSSLANIECEIVNGFARTSMINVETLFTPNHSWNAVKLNGKWYLCDPTWASGVPNATTNRFEFYYNDGFFLGNPQLFAINHFPIDEKWWLLDEQPPTFENFLEAPVFYGKTYSNLSFYSEPKKMHNTVQKNETVIFKCELSKPANKDDISLLLDNGNGSKTIYPQGTSIKNKSLTVEYAFEHTGFYDVHLLIGADLVSSYTFKVKK